MNPPCLKEVTQVCLHGCCPSPLFNLSDPQNTLAKPRSSSSVCRRNFATKTTSSFFPNTQFTNHESLPCLQESLARFKKAYPQYSETKRIDHIRSQEYDHLSVSNHVCLDYIGIGLFSHSQLQTQNSSKSQNSNFPFFSISCKSASLKFQLLHGTKGSELESAVKKRIMGFLNISENDYSMVFTANRSSAFKLLAESYPFQTSRKLLTIYDYESEAVETMINTSEKRPPRPFFFHFPFSHFTCRATELAKVLERESKAIYIEREKEMDSDQGKLFIGGISWETTEELLKEYFNNYGEVLQAVVMRDKLTTKPRGFGFVVFSDPSILDRVLQDKHTIDGRTVEAKRALSREEQQTSGRSGNTNTARNYGGGGNFRTKKIFVGGLPPTLTEDEFRQYFEAYGSVIDVVVMYDQQTNRPRGFGFISFDSEDAVDRVLQRNFHDLNGKQVEVKRAQPKDSNPSGGGRSMSGGGGGGGYQGSGGNSSTYDGRMDSNRYMQSQTTGGGFPPYGSSGYNAASYGYGPASNGIAYGGYGGSASSAYGNLNVANAGYGSGPLGAPRSSWSTQAPSGYGGYGNAASWGAPSPNSGGGPVSATTGQSPSGPTGYGNQGYGYGAGYGGSDGSYANPAAYSAGGGRAGSAPNSNASSGGGAGGGELQGNGGGYMGGGYGDPNGNSGYGNPGWRVDPSQTSGNYAGHASGPHGGQVGYGGGYSAPARQAQQQ